MLQSSFLSKIIENITEIIADLYIYNCKWYFLVAKNLGRQAYTTAFSTDTRTFENQYCPAISCVLSLDVQPTAKLFIAISLSTFCSFLALMTFRLAIHATNKSNNNLNSSNSDSMEAPTNSPREPPTRAIRSPACGQQNRGDGVRLKIRMVE